MNTPLPRSIFGEVQALCYAAVGLSSVFREKGMRPRQVVISGTIMPPRHPLRTVCGLPVGWIERSGPGWTLEMVGDEFAYGSVRVEADGQCRTCYAPERGWLPDRMREDVRSNFMLRFVSDSITRLGETLLTFRPTPPVVP